MSDAAEPVSPPPPSSSSTPSGAAASPADDAAAKRAARKARILGKGTDRLNRITQTGRGQEAAELYPSSPPPLASPRAAPSAAASSAAVAAPPADDGEPPEIDISSLRAMQPADASPFAGQPDGMPAFPGMPEGMQLPPQMAQMFAQLQSAMGGAGGASAADGASPFGASPFGGMPGAEDFAASKTDRIFAVVRTLLCVAFGSYLILPLLHAHKAAGAGEGLIAHVHGGAMMHWARLGYERPSPWDAGMYGVEQLGLGGIPVFYLFITLEIVLQSTRIMLLRSRPPPPSLAQKVAPFLPPVVSSLLLTGSSYVSLLNSLVNDVAIVVFVLGIAILYAGWRVGYDPLAQ